MSAGDFCSKPFFSPEGLEHSKHKHIKQDEFDSCKKERDTQVLVLDHETSCEYFPVTSVPVFFDKITKVFGAYEQ